VEYVPEVEREMGKFDIQFCPTSLYFRNLSYQQKGTVASLYPTNINYNPLLKR
jgi:hypothetical protein